MKTLIVASAVVFALSFAVTAHAEYARCHNRAVKSCNTYESGQGVENERNGGGRVAQTADRK